MEADFGTVVEELLGCKLSSLPRPFNVSLDLSGAHINSISSLIISMAIKISLFLVDNEILLSENK